MTLFAADPARMEGFGTIQGSDGEVTLAELEGGEAYLNEDAAAELGVAHGRPRAHLRRRPAAPGEVADVVRYEGAGTDGSALLLPLAEAQSFVGRPDSIRHVLISNSGDERSRSRR